MPREIRCIITGCDLVLAEGTRYHGDLFTTRDTYIFNAVVSGNGARVIEEPHSDKELQIPHGADTWERRGVFIIPHSQGRLNLAADEYIHKY